MGKTKDRSPHTDTGTVLIYYHKMKWTSHTDVRSTRITMYGTDGIVWDEAYYYNSFFFGPRSCNIFRDICRTKKERQKPLTTHDTAKTKEIVIANLSDLWRRLRRPVWLCVCVCVNKTRIYMQSLMFCRVQFSRRWCVARPSALSLNRWTNDLYYSLRIQTDRRRKQQPKKKNKNTSE